MMFGCSTNQVSAVLWIRNGFRADPDPAFLVIADPDVDLDLDQKLQKKLQLKIFFISSKFAIYLSLGFQKGRLSKRRSHRPSKENIQHFKS
jgi:hypothetical protein